MAVFRYDAPSSWATAFNAADMNSLANTAGILSTATAIDNTTNRDRYMDVEFRLGSITPTTGAYLALFVLPILGDASTYPSSANGTGATNWPSMEYLERSVPLRTGAATQNIIMRRIEIIPAVMKLYLANGANVALAASANTSQYRTYTDESA